MTKVNDEEAPKGSSFNSLNLYLEVTKILQTFICMSLVFLAICHNPH